MHLSCNHLYFLFDIEGSVIQALANITLIEGENSTLTCHVSGAPMPSVSWTEVTTGHRTEGNIRVLVNVSRSDAREYKCEASNFCQEMTPKAHLRLLTVSYYCPCRNSVYFKYTFIFLKKCTLFVLKVL